MRFRRGRRCVRACGARRAEGGCCRYVIELDGQFAGQLTIGNVTHGALRSAWIGYWVTKDFTGGGVATAALALGLDHAFGPVMLHRVEATVRPGERGQPGGAGQAGFREEGLLKRYLDVDGAWRDHLLVAITVEEVEGSVASRHWCARVGPAGPELAPFSASVRLGVCGPP